MRRTALCFLICSAATTACLTQGGRAWVDGASEPPEPGDRPPDVAPLTSTGRPAGSAEDGALQFSAVPECTDEGDCVPEPIVVQQYGSGTRAVISSGLPDNLFRNTYYDFPKEGGGAKDATIYDAKCKEIAKVPQEFHDRVCVQGSGQLASGQTVSFAKRGCECAALCPRTSQKICFEALDPAKFPHGRGATGKAITPLRTIAVDSSVIPLGTPVYIAEFAGLPKPDGTKHDGCFVAEDRGVRVIGRQVDVFTGDPSITTKWNKLVPSNRGVRVKPNDPRCPKP